MGQTGQKKTPKKLGGYGWKERRLSLADAAVFAHVDGRRGRRLAVRSVLAVGSEEAGHARAIKPPASPIPCSSFFCFVFKKGPFDSLTHTHTRTQNDHNIRTQYSSQGQTQVSRSNSSAASELGSILETKILGITKFDLVLPAFS